MSQLENPSRLGVMYHKGLRYGHKIILWGGCFMTSNVIKFSPSEMLHVYNPITKRWRSYRCTGSPPSECLTANVHVVGKYMYVIEMIKNDIFRLDLKAYNWERVKATGVPPLSYIYQRSSWVWQEKIYIYGGVSTGTVTYNRMPPEHANISFHDEDSGIVNNQCVTLNTRTHSWEWPPSRSRNGSSPAALAPCQCIVSGDFMFAFGKPIGQPHVSSLRNIQVLHMPTHTWTNPQICEPNVLVEAGNYTLTVTGENRAIFYGGNSETICNFGASTVWLLTWTTNKTGVKDLSCRLWSLKNCNVRIFHKTIFSPETSRLYLVGGKNKYFDSHKFLEEKPPALGCYSILAGPATLLESSLHAVIQSGCNLTPIELLNLPCDLKNW